ncbi:uncharacterized protein B0H18DRAFT_1001958 [Fomitopsis serialis]|uniref:uncharacterized protein n=1 Tax=Fomitopsis serialis TaxID=139415 RepID=UPI002007CBDD|nr:uncharacterized protein B0H18DRAFT_1001958 [Neoantrodia serialis]KAH9927739.1 hypothetical protein B0H18DRAFT_1001958 [Neoantrodia serialis]
MLLDAGIKDVLWPYTFLSIALSVPFSAPLQASTDTPPQVRQLLTFFLSHLASAVFRSRFPPDKTPGPMRSKIPPELRPVYRALRAWLRGWAGYLEQHYRSPAEIAEDNWHWGAELRWWPGTPELARLAHQMPFRVVPRQPGWVRVSWYYDIKEMFPDARVHPEMYVHLQLEPDGSLKIGDVRRKWGMENMCFVEWNSQRISLWPSADDETLSAIAVQHLLSTREQYPYLRVIERPSAERRTVRLHRANLLKSHNRPRPLRIYLRLRHIYLLAAKFWFRLHYRFLRLHYPFLLSTPVRERLAVTCATVVCVAVLALAVCAVWWAWTAAIAERVGYVSGRVVDGVVAWAGEHPLVGLVAGWASAAVGALPMRAFWAATLPVWGPFWLVKSVLMGVWWLATALLWTAMAGMRWGALGVRVHVKAAAAALQSCLVRENIA